MKIKRASLLGLPILLLLLLVGRTYGAQQPAKAVLRVKLVDSNPNAKTVPSGEYPVPSYYCASWEQGKKDFDSIKFKRGWIKDVYPGIDLVCYGDDSHIEYIFVAPPGSDPSLIRLACEGARKITLDHSQQITIDMINSEVDQSRAVVFLQSGSTARKVYGIYNIDQDSIIDITPGKEFEKQVSNDQFLEFLNSAQTNSSSPFGANMYFDKDGNVWINAAMKEDSMMFDVDASRLAYDSGQASGSRYYYKNGPKGRAHFADKPVAGVSWLGAMKYCNWQTLRAGRSAGKRSYMEGPNISDWTPAPATNWAKGFFEAISTDEAKGFQFVTPYLPSDTFVIHILYSFYFKPGAAEQEKIAVVGTGERTPGAEEGMAEAPTETTETKGGGSPFSVDVIVPPTEGNEIAPNGVAYQNPPQEGEVSPTPPAPPVEGGVVEETVVPPPESPSTNAPGPPGPVYYTLSVASLDPTRGILIDVTPIDINGLAGDITPFQRTYLSGTTVTLTAPSLYPGGTVFQGWESSVAAYNTTSQVVTVTMSGDLTMTAVYMAPTHLIVQSFSPIVGVPIQVSVPDIFTGATGGNTAFTLSYYSNTTVTLTSPPVSSGGAFLRWLQNGTFWSSNAITTVTLVSDTTMTAVFFTHNLYVRASGAGTGVPITISPNDVGGNGNGTTPFDRAYGDGTTVTLTAPPAANGNIFQEWERDGVNYSTNFTTSVFMDIDYTMLAVYLYVPSPIPNPPVSPSGI